MKILVIGATYISNFGDILFAKMMANKLEGKAEFRFPVMSEFCADFVGKDRLGDFGDKDADAVLYMPGGYLGDGYKTDLYHTYLWFKRYFTIGLSYARRKKPMLILGVDAGPCRYWFMRKIIRYICRNSWRVVVRNEDSRQFLLKIGVPDEKLAVSSDYAQLIAREPLPEMPAFEAWKAAAPGKKILIHVNNCEEARNAILPAVKRYYEKHDRKCSLVVAGDHCCEEDIIAYRQAEQFAGKNAYYCEYRDPLELCSVIRGCDCVITYKLHVGIVASCYSRSVIPVPQYAAKIEKYYKQIGESERVIRLAEADPDKVYDALEKYIDTPVVLSDDIWKMAESNNAHLDGFLEYVAKQSGAEAI